MCQLSYAVLDQAGRGVTARVRPLAVRNLGITEQLFECEQGLSYLLRLLNLACARGLGAEQHLRLGQ